MEAMSDRTAIEWTEATWNPVAGCSKVSPGCAHCYAERLSLRFGRSRKPWLPKHAAENVVLHEERLSQPLRWKRPRLVFVNSMSDLFHELVPLDFIKRVFAVMIEAEGHTFQVLTKRHERMEELAPKLPWPPNIWMGVSIENNRWALRADYLRRVPAAVRFISAEPLLGPLDALDLSATRRMCAPRGRVLLQAVGRPHLEGWRSEARRRNVRSDAAAPCYSLKRTFVPAGYVNRFRRSFALTISNLSACSRGLRVRFLTCEGMYGVSTSVNSSASSIVKGSGPKCSIIASRSGVVSTVCSKSGCIPEDVVSL